MKQILIFVTLLTLILGLGLVLYSTSNQEDTIEVIGSAIDYKNAIYVIEGEPIKLENGVNETPMALGLDTKKVTRYFGSELITDLNDDGKDDVVFLLTQETGGSGVYYYVVAALNTDSGYVGSEALLLGDRIAPQNIVKGEGGMVIVNYADRAPGEPYTATPSVGKSIWLILDPETLQFGQVEQNFSGEANPEMMTLAMKSWVFISATDGAGNIFVPQKPDAFGLMFGNQNQFSATTDCNNTGGTYNISGQSLALTDIFTTLMYCEGSEESEFVGFLSNVESYQFTNKGELLLGLNDGGEMAFR